MTPNVPGSGDVMLDAILMTLTAVIRGVMVLGLLAALAFGILLALESLGIDLAARRSRTRGYAYRLDGRYPSQPRYYVLHDDGETVVYSRSGRILDVRPGQAAPQGQTVQRSRRHRVTAG